MKRPNRYILVDGRRLPVNTADQLATAIRRARSAGAKNGDRFAVHDATTDAVIPNVVAEVRF